MTFFQVMCFEYNSWVTLFNDHLIIQEIAVFKLVVCLDKFDRKSDNCDLIFPNYFYGEEKTLVKHLVKYLQQKLLELEDSKTFMRN